MSRLRILPSRELPLVRVQQERAELNGLPRARGKFFMNEYLRRGKVPRQQRPAYVGMRERISRSASEVGSSRVAPQERIVFLSQQKI